MILIQRFVLGKCQCGCGEDIPIAVRRSKWRLQRFKHHHQLKLIDNKGTNNGMWKGDEVGYGKLHIWVRLYLPKPDKCEMCKKAEPHDLANITGVYNREFKNWQYLCRRCHMLSDGRMKNLKQYRTELTPRVRAGMA